MSAPPQTTAPVEPAVQEPMRGSQESLNSNDVPTMVRVDAKLQELMKELTCEIPPDDAAEPCKPRNFRHPPPGNEDAAWGECSRHIESHDEDLCKAFREEIDTLLVFAGLFSAIVTAFSIESYPWLSGSPDSHALLVQAVTLLAQNATNVAVPGQSSTGLTGAAATRINAYWFLSLTLSLSSALVGILCKQWVREFSHQPRTTGPELVGVRQMKYEGFQAWRVGEIISFLPLLLQLALGLFFLGILEFLWTLHRSVAITVTAAASVTLVFYLATTIVPAFQHVFLFSTWFGASSAGMPQCPYKSPQSLLILRMMTALFAVRVPSNADDEESLLQSRADSHPFDSWVLFDGRYDTLCNRSLPKESPKSHWRGLAWLLETTSRPGLREHVWHCLWANALRHLSDGKTNDSQLQGSPGPWHVLKTDPRTEYIANAIPDSPSPPIPGPHQGSDQAPSTQGSFASQSWWAATTMYSVETSFNETTRLEIYIRALSTWPTIDPLTAYQTLDIILPDAALKGLKLKGLPGSLVRCAISFCNRNRDTRVLGMGHFLRKVAACLAADRSKSADAHLACLSILYIRWLGAWGYHHNAAVAANNATMAELVVRRVKRRVKRLPHDERNLHSLPHIEEFAELLLLTTLPYWDPVFQGPHSRIDWGRFHPLFTTTLRDNETLFRELVAIAIPAAWRIPPPIIVPRTISAPMTRQELECLFMMRRTLARAAVSPGNDTTAPDTSPAHGPIIPGEIAQQLDVVSDDQRQGRVLSVVGQHIGTEGRTGELRCGETPVSHARAALATDPAESSATMAVPPSRAVSGTASGPEVIRALSTDSTSRSAVLRQPAGRSPRPIWLSRSHSIPSLLSAQSGDVRSESPDSRRAGSGGSIASMDTSRSMFGGPRGQLARTPAARRRDTGDGASQTASDMM